MQYTENYNLKKPGQEDFYDVDDFNSNMDTLDAEFKQKEEVLETHVGSEIFGESGIHGFRYYNNEMQVKNEEGEWVAAEAGGLGVSPSNVSGIRVKVNNEKLTIFWSDPGDTVVEGQTISTWKGTKLVWKVGAFPETVKDGVLMVDNQVLDAFKDNGFEINALTNGVTYYFALFPYSDTGAVNINPANRLSGTPEPYMTMTVEIDLANDNPSTAVTYADDAVGMIPGSDEWDEFFGHYPCLFKNGAEVGKLQRNDFTKFEDGKVADISSGAAGDVMICFPRRGLKINTVGNILTISMTDAPDDDKNYEYNAHTKGTERKEKFYLGAYKGAIVDSKLRSLKGKTPGAGYAIGVYRTFARANGAGYEQSAFYQLIFRQAMFILKYKNLNSEETIGHGWESLNNTNSTPTGDSEAYGMDSEIIKATNPSYMTDRLHHVKLFGLEDFWGNVWEWIDGCVTSNTRNILTANSGFNDTGKDYIDNGQATTKNIGSFIAKPQGTTKTGFIIKEEGASATTFFCDYGSLGNSCVSRFGGSWAYTATGNSGIFQMQIYDTATATSESTGARLMYL